MTDSQAATLEWPRRRVIAGAVFFDDEGRVLIVKPSYREGWLLPGGVVERDETPAAACVREVEEELGLNVELGRLLCVEHVAAFEDRPEAVSFVFLGGVLDRSRHDEIKLPPDELVEWAFVEPSIANDRLIPRVARRLELALTAFKEERTVYGEDGRERPSPSAG